MRALCGSPEWYRLGAREYRRKGKFEWAQALENAALDVERDWLAARNVWDRVTEGHE